MSTELETQLRKMLLSYERLDAAWRMRFELSANEKLALLHIVDGIDAPTELAALIGVTSGGMTSLLDRLEDRGYVTREHHPNDGRRMVVLLTPAAIEARLEFDATAFGMLQDLDESEGAAVLHFLTYATEFAARHAHATIEASGSTLDEVADE